MDKINQQELARRLGLSQTTVSRSLANHPAINAETKALVLETAAKLGYSNRLSRRAVIASHEEGSLVWGVIISMPKRHTGESESFQQILKGIADKSSLQGSILDVVFHEPGDAAPGKLLKRMRASSWMGAILIHPIERDLAHEIAHQGPCASIIENYRHDLIDSIDVDQSESIFDLVTSLCELGHRRIAYLTWPYQVPTPWVLRRFGSYVEAMHRNGLEYNPDDAINTRPEEALEPESCLERVLELIGTGVTAVVCAADHQAYRLIQDLESRGVTVPGDVSVTGFDGIPPLLIDRQVATVRVPYEELGRSAVHTLLRRLEQPTAPRRHILVDGELIKGDTLGKPRR